MSDVVQIISLIVSSSVIAALVSGLFARKKNAADTAGTLVDSSISLVEMQDKKIDVMEERITILEADLHDAYLVIKSLLVTLQENGITPNSIDHETLDRVIKRANSVVHVQKRKAAKK